jgi:hypothetical protein
MCPRKTEDGPGGARAHNGRPYLPIGRYDVNFFITVTVEVQSPKRNSLKQNKQPKSKLRQRHLQASKQPVKCVSRLLTAPFR